jgi:hypothetical protein
MRPPIPRQRRALHPVGPGANGPGTSADRVKTTSGSPRPLVGLERGAMSRAVTKTRRRRLRIPGRGHGAGGWAGRVMRERR